MEADPLRRLRLPDGWSLIAGADTGTFMSATVWAIPPDDFDPPGLCCLAEFPNYRYVGGEIELTGLSNEQWATALVGFIRHLSPGGGIVQAWADPNTQFKADLQHYGLLLRPNTRKLELRVEVAREYMQSRLIWLAPWLQILPYEIEHAEWPDDTTVTGKFERIKRKDHTLDTMEHVLSRRPRSRTVLQSKNKSFLDRVFDEFRVPLPARGDPHLGPF